MKPADYYPPEIRDAYTAARLVLETAVTAGIAKIIEAHCYDAVPGHETEFCAAWNEQYRLRKVADKLRLEHLRMQGRNYWTARGIAVGQKVHGFAHHMLTGASIRVDGIAKTGVSGAYVSSKFQQGKLSPDSFAA